MADKFAGFAVEVLKLSTGQTMSITVPITPWAALVTTIPTKVAGGTEVSGGSYARINASGKFAAPVPASAAGDTYAATVQTNADLVFPTATAAWGNLKAVLIFPAQNSNSPYLYAPLAIPRDINSGDPVVIPAGSLSFVEL